MSYDYETEKPRLFTEKGQVVFLAVRDAVTQLLTFAGAARSSEITSAATRRLGALDSWQALACLDRLVEINELREITADDNVAAQDRVYVSAKSFP